jgi:uncharacterized protein YpuA (DUF1002 family)
MTGRKDEITKVWISKTVIGVVILLFLTGVVTWASGVSVSMNTTQTDIVRIDSELSQHKAQATIDRVETRDSFNRLEKKLDRLIERR